MNIEVIKSALKTNFVDITNPIDDVLRATKQHEQGVYQVHYFDLSQKLFNQDFDFDRYQRQLLIKDFYSVEGALQWNFYLHFIVEEEKLKNPNYSSIKLRIETDKRLARKSVSTYSEFKKSYQPRKVANDQMPIDVVDRWKSFLLDDGLIDVLDDKVAMKSVVESYVEGIQERKAAPNTSRTIVQDFPLIGELTLEEYRPFPTKHNYSFGLINLISGPNAVGKTSLLEALELIVCGKTMRNPSVKENFNFSIIPMGSAASMNISRASDVEYRSRDHLWYGRNYSRGNELIKSFARFNFFDADAAVQFSERIDSGGGLGKTLIQIVLGPDADRLFERIGKIQSRFKESRNYLDKLIDADTAAKENIDEEILSKTKADSEIISQELIQSRLEKIGSKLTRFDTQDLERFLEGIGHCNMAIVSWKTAMERFGVRTYSSFNEVMLTIEKSIEEFVKCDLAGNTINEKLKKANDTIKLKKIQLNEIERLRMYQSSGASDLPSLDMAARQLAEDIQIFDKAIRYFREIDKKSLTIFFDISILDARKQTERNLSELRDQESNSYEKLQEIRTKLDSASLIIKEIRIKAKDYVGLHPSVADCPLCGTDLAPGNLAQRLKAPIESVESGRIDIDVLLQTISELTTKRKIAEKQVVSLQQLTQTIELLPKLRDDKMSISELFKQIQVVSEYQSGQNREYEVVKLKLEKYKTDGFNAVELNQLMNKLEVGSGIGEIGPLLNGLYENTTMSLKKTNQEIEGFLVAKNEIAERVEQIKETCKAFKTVDTFSIQNLNNELKNIFSDVNNIENFLSLSQNDTAASVDKRLTQAKELVGTYLRSLAEQKSLRKLAESLKVVRKNIDNNQTKLNRACHALKILTKLTEEEKPEIQLIDFLTKHTEQISDIFNQIHSPQEFEGVRLVDGELFALRKSNGENTPLNKLSTGQRTALVLSVFLSMNEIISTGPRLLIFDDPVTYVDDLNVLSFIDYILRMSEKEDRQIFFATANKRIASLFAKKFDFLKNKPGGFKSIELGRV